MESMLIEMLEQVHSIIMSVTIEEEEEEEEDTA